MPEEVKDILSNRPDVMNDTDGAEAIGGAEATDLFVGKYDDIDSHDAAPTPTTRVKPVAAGQGLADPRNSTSLQSIIGTAFESTSLTTRVTNFGHVDPFTISALESNGLNTTVSSVLGGVNLNSFGMKGTGLTFSSFDSLSSYTHQDYETKVMPFASNLKPSTNPLGMSNLSLNGLLTLFDQAINQGLDDNEAEAQATRDGIAIDTVRLQIYDVNSGIEALRTTFSNLADSLDDLITDSSEKKILKSFRNSFELLYITDAVIKGGTVRDQIIDLKAFLRSLQNKLLTYRSILSVPDSIQTQLETLSAEIKSYANRLGVISEENADVVAIMVEDIRGLIPSKGIFIERGQNQEADYEAPSNFSSLINLPIFEGLRSDYSAKGHTSVSKLATSYGSKTESRREYIEDAEDFVASRGGEPAVKADSQGDKLQESSKVTTIAYNDAVGPLSVSDYSKYRDKIAELESTNNPAAVNQIGYLGLYQFGAAALTDMGYVKPATSTRSLKYDRVWTGKDGINSRSDFLSDSGLQKTIMLRYTKRNYKSLLRMKVVTPQSDAATVAGLLAASHLKGPGGARDFKNGRDNADANGTKTSKYYSTLYAHLNGTGSGSTTTTANAATNEEAVETNTIPDVAVIRPPASTAAPVYPHNKTVEYEAGHIQEFDSTPGAERIKEAHATGTGYEVDPDGTRKVMIVGDGYRVVAGSDYMIVQGQVQIMVQGDCGIKAAGDLTLDAGNDLNLNVGGNLNISTKGNRADNTYGNRLDATHGDSAETVGGFKKVGVEGNIHTEASSVNFAARETEFNVVAGSNVNMIAAAAMNFSSTGALSAESAGAVNLTAGGELKAVAGSSLIASALGGSASFTGSDKATLSSDGEVHLSGSRIKPSPEIDCAKYAIETSTAQVLGGVTVIPAEGEAGESGSDTHSERQKRTSADVTTKSASEFLPIDGAETEAYAGGVEAKTKSYNSGVIT